MEKIRILIILAALIGLLTFGSPVLAGEKATFQTIHNIPSDWRLVTFALTPTARSGIYNQELWFQDKAGNVFRVLIDDMDRCELTILWKLPVRGSN